MKRTIKELIEIENQKRENLNKLRNEMKSVYKKYMSPIRKKVSKAGDEYQEANMDIWYIFGLNNENGTRGRKEYTDLEKKEAKKYYYRGIQYECKR